MRFAQRAQENEAYAIGLRRDFHAHPELSFQEFRTADIVCAELEKMGIPYERLENNGIIGRIKGIQGGKRLAIRADMDALPVEEETGKPYASQNPGVMHACGHDGHTAMLLGIGKLLAEIKEELKGEVFLCFQPAEEIGRGAQELIQYLEATGGVDEAIAAHLWADIPSGEISVVRGPRMAAGSSFTVEVLGRGGHASRPDLAIDPLKPAANILLAISAIPTNRYKTIEPLVVHVGQIHGGTMGNTFPQKAELKGGIRSFSATGEEEARALIKDIAENCARMYGATAKVMFRQGVPVVFNSADSVERAERTLEKTGNLKNVEFEPICASENFGCFMQQYQGFMAFIGVRNKEKGVVFAQHHPKFDIDEDVLWKGIELFAQYAFDFLSE